MKSKIITLILMFLLVTTIVEALGVMPGIKSFYFEENLEKEIKLTILNNEHKDIKLAIYAKGTLLEYIEIPTKRIELKADEQEKELTYKIKLPSKIEEPGLHPVDIVIREITQEGGNMRIDTIQAVISQLHVYVPYPGKYIVAKLDIVGGKIDKKTRFFVPLINYGEEDVSSAKAEIIIMDMYEKIMNKIETDEQPVPGKGKAELSAEMNASELTPGIYRVIAKVNYDGLTTTAENTFYKGEFLLIPLDISVKRFTLGQIAQLDVLVENIGNVKIKDAFSLILLDSEDGKSIANVKSPSTDFEPLETKEIASHWNTKDVEEGEYNGKLVLKYEDKSDEKRIVTSVKKNSIEVEIVGITGYAIKEEMPSEKHASVVWIIVIISVTINICWFVYYFMSRKKVKFKK